MREIHKFQKGGNADLVIENWVNVPTNSILTIHGQTVMAHPIMDKYSKRGPNHVRSSAFVQAKGLTSNEKAQSDSTTPAALDSQPDLDGYRKMMAGSIPPFGPSRSLSPDLSRRSMTPTSLREISVTVPSHASPSSEHSKKVVPAQGNIKVKRRSVQPLEGTPSPAELDQPSEDEEPTRAEVRNPRKLSQYFPELTLVTPSA